MIINIINTLIFWLPHEQMPNQLLSFVQEDLRHWEHLGLPGLLWMFHTPQEHNPKNVSKNINTFQSKSKTIAPLCQRHLRFVSTNDKEMYLHKSSTSIKICLKVFNLSILSKLVINVIFLSFLMDVCYKQNPSFYRCKILQMPCLITKQKLPE